MEHNLFINGHIMPVGSLPDVLELFDRYDKDIYDLSFVEWDIDSFPENIFSRPTMKNLKSVTISDSSIKKIPSNIFTPLHNLKILDIRRSDISLTPQFFSSLDNLEELSLFANSIQELPPDIFSGLHNLKLLDVRFNKISCLPETLFHPLTSLETLHLEYNNIEHISSTHFMGLKNLRNLHVCSNSLEHIPDLSSLLPSLKQLRCSDNFLTRLPSLPVNCECDFFPQQKKIPRMNMKITDVICIISHDPIYENIEYRKCTNPIQPHYYIHKNWERWENFTGKTKCVCNDNCVIDDTIYTNL